jgi:hypothetical protein
MHNHQIIERYVKWMKEATPPNEMTGHGRSETPPPREISNNEGNNPHLVGDDERLRQLAAIISDVKKLADQIMLMWNDTISLYAQPSEDVPLAGRYCAFL